MACVTACPSGVQYDRLIERVRPQIERHGARTRARAAVPDGDLRALHPPRPAARARAGHGAPAPAAARGALRRPAALPARWRRRSRCARRCRGCPRSRPRSAPSAARVALMQGCVQRVFFGDVNAATVRVLAAEGFEVHAPREPRCCGALQFHSGVEDPARELARGDGRRLRGLRPRGRQRRGLRLGDEGLRAPVRGRAAHGGVLGQGPRRPRVPRRARAAARSAIRCR